MKFSVIVPVYNAEKHIKKCVNSIISQTYKNWELILIDDGSSDKSAEIIDNYAKKDDRIISIHQDNAGAGAARNKGIDNAGGDYLVFIDSDDYIDKDYFSLLSEKANKADIVFIDIIQVSPDGKVLCRENLSSCQNWSKDRILRSQMTGKIPWGGCRKAVRRSVLTENNIRYTDHKVGEEHLYSFRILFHSDKIEFLTKKAVYYYVNHEGSLSKTKMTDPWGGVVDTISDYLKKNGLYKRFADTINAFNITATVVSLDRINLIYKGTEKKKQLKMRMNKFQKSFDKCAPVDEKNMSIKSKIFIPFIMKGITWPVILLSNCRKII